MKLIVIAFMTSCCIGLVAPDCDNLEVLQAGTKCGIKFAEENGYLNRDPNELPREGKIDFACCGINYNKHCLPGALKGKGCDEKIREYLQQAERLTATALNISSCDYSHCKNAGEVKSPAWPLVTAVLLLSAIASSTL